MTKTKSKELDTLVLYCSQISSIKPLSQEKEKELAYKIKKGDRKAELQLIKANLRFVISVAKNYQNQGIDLKDLISEGNIGLIRAAKSFEPDKNFKFISYAVWWIRQSILQAISEQSRTTKIPLNKSGDVYKIRKAIDKLEQKLHRVPTDEEVANSLSKNIEEVRAIRDIMTPAVYLDNAVDGETPLIANFSVEEEHFSEQIEYVSFKKQIKKIIDYLPEKQKFVIVNYFGIDKDYCKTLEEIGNDLDLTRERVRQLKNSALFMLKKIIIKNKKQADLE